MGSKVIFDSTQILDEDLITLTEACRCFPVRCSRAAIERWVRQGSRGIVLQSALLCGRRYTSREAIERFIRGQLRVEADQPEPKKGNMSKEELVSACQKYGLPSPLESNQRGDL